MRALPGLMIVAALAGGCSKPLPDPLQLERNLLTVDNRTSNDWTDVEIWLNQQFRVTARSIPAGGRLQAPLDNFVEGFGRRFEWRRMQVKDLRLKAKLPGGEPFELQKQFEQGGLAGALRGVAGGKR